MISPTVALLSLAVCPSAFAAGPPEDTSDEAMLRELRALREEVAALRRQAEAEGAAPGIDGLDGAGDVPSGLATVGPNGERVGYGEVVLVRPDETVEEVVSFGNDVHVAGHVEGDAVSFGGNVQVARTGTVDGDAVSFGGRVQVDDGGVVNGNRVAMGVPMALPVAVAPPSSAEPSGAAGNLRLATDTQTFFQWLYRRLVLMLSVAGAGVLVVGLFPARVGRVAQDLEARPVRAAVVGTLATGFLAAFGVLFAIVTLGLGSPISVLLFLALAVAWLLGFVGFCQAVGDRLPVRERPHGRWIAFLVGIVLLTFLGSLPWVGMLVVGAASLLGIGAALSTRFGRP